MKKTNQKLTFSTKSLLLELAKVGEKFKKKSKPKNLSKNYKRILYS